MKNIEQFFRLAAIISALPNTISNGQTADATPVMADLNHIVNQVNANAADATLVPLLAAANSFTAVQSGLAATAAANFPIVTQIQDSVFLTLTSTLGTNTITARSLLLPLGALANGQIFTFAPSQTNSGPVTLNPDSLGATTVFRGGTNVMSGQIVANVPMALRYESPNFHVLGGTLTDAGSLIGTTLAANVVTSSLTTVGALNSGSITNGFGSIDIGADSLTVGGAVLFNNAAADIRIGTAAGTGHIANDVVGAYFKVFGSSHATTPGRVEISSNAATGIRLQASAVDVAVFTSGATALTGTLAMTGALIMSTTASPTGAGTGVVGQFAWDTAYLYICTATNDWRRVALTDF